MTPLALILQDLQDTAVVLSDLQARIAQHPDDDILKVNAETLLKVRHDLEHVTQKQYEFLPLERGREAAMRTLARRRLIRAARASATAVPAYTVLRPWRR